MTSKKKLKARIRARTRKTGESYSVARHHMVAEANLPPSSAPQPPAPSRPEREWEPLIRTSPDEARQILQRALALEQRLTRYGYGIPDERAKRRRAKRYGTGLCEIEREYRELREDLEGRVQEVAVCVDFLREIDRIKTINRRWSSYGLKHLVESWFRLRGGYGYAWNGSFVAAALGLGLELKPGRDDSPCPSFNLSERSIRSFMKRTGAIPV